MILDVTEIQPGDLRHLFCSDPQLKNEIARLKRSGRRPVAPIAVRFDAEPADKVSNRQPKSAA